MIKQETIIFDLFGVLFYLNVMPLLKHVGIWDLTYYALKNRQTPFTTFFIILEKMRLEVPGEYQNKVTYQGKFLPKSICNWQRGLLSNNEMLERLTTFIHQLGDKYFFKAQWEKSLIIKSAHAAFNSKNLLQACVINKPVYSILKTLKQSNYPLYILSNIDQDIFLELKQRYAELFAQFNGIVTSFETQLLKPEPEIYLYLCKQYNLQSQQCCFIDDQSENIEVAKLIGMKTILYRRGENLLKKLKRLSIEPL